MKKDSLVVMGDSLEEVETKIDELKAAMEPLEEQAKLMRGAMVAELQSRGIDYMKTTSGYAYGIVSGRVSYKVKMGMENDAIKWAMAEFPGILSIAAAKLSKVVQPMLKMPDFIERTQGEPHLAVRSQETD